jgi:phosphoglycolate phosphatase
MRPGIRAVLFDLDGTLLDSAPDLGAAADQMRLERGLESIPLERYRPFCGSGARGMLSVAFGITPEHADFPAMREEFFVNYENRMTLSTHAFDGVERLVGELVRRGIPWGVVTNKSKRFTDPLLASMPLFATAGALVSGDTTPHAKPHPAPLLEAARRIGVEAEHCVYVGDDERDIAAGKAAGMATLAASWGYLGVQSALRDWNADADIEFPLGVLKWLDLA